MANKITSAKVSNFSGQLEDLERIVRRFSPRTTRIDAYGEEEKPLLAPHLARQDYCVSYISKGAVLVATYHRPAHVKGYNLVITVTSDSAEKNGGILERFEKETEITLATAPSNIRVESTLGHSIGRYIPSGDDDSDPKLAGIAAE
jgi:hypothetical protein